MSTSCVQNNIRAEQQQQHCIQTLNDMDTRRRDRPQLKEGLLGSTHKVMKVLGEGAYAVVMKCHNVRTNKMEAVKLYKQHPNVVGLAQLEIGILERLRRLYSYRCNIVLWDSYFYTNTSIGLSFELLDIDLCSYVSGPSWTRTLTAAEVRPILHQITTALFHLKSMGIIHADLKPENILCVDRHQQPLQVKLADFGLARVSNNFDPVLPAQTLWYRAPEVLVGHKYDEAIDMWSLGVTAAGLILGVPLYRVYNEYDALRAIIQTQGRLPDHLLDHGRFTKDYFVKNVDSSSQWTLKAPEVYERQAGYHLEKKLFTLNDLDDICDIMNITSGKQRDHFRLVDLIKKMLHLDPSKRIEPLQALLHGFFNEETFSCPAKDPSRP